MAEEADRPLMHIAPATSLAFTISAQPGAYALLVGAGASMSAGMMSAWHVQRELILRIAAAERAEDEARGDGSDEGHPFVWFATRFGEEATYDRLLDEVGPRQLQRRNLLQEFFIATNDDRQSGVKQPVAAHHAIAALVGTGHIKVIITLNFDHLIEEALRAANIEPVVVNTEAGIRGLQPLHEYQCLIVHLHGDYTHPEMRNTPDELSTYPPSILGFLRRLQEDFGLLATGWSGQWDPALRDAIDAAGATRYPMYWVNPSAPRGDGADLATRKRAIICEATADDFFPDLHARIDAIESRRQRHPLDAATLVTTAKRELDNVNSRAIATHDNLRAEIRSLHELDAYVNIRSLASLRDEQMDEWTTAILEHIKPLGALVGTLAYWGTPDTDTWWIDELSKIAPKRYDNHQTGDHHLRPGAYLYAVAGVSAIAAGRINVAARILAEPSPLPFLRRAVDMFGPSAFSGGSDRGPSRSRQLFELVEPTLRDHLLLSPSRIRQAWDTWQYLDAIHVDYLDADKQPGSSHGIPPHIARLSSNLPAIFETVKALASDDEWGADHAPIVQALFGGERTKLAEAMTRYNEYLGRGEFHYRHYAYFDGYSD
ncbi:SIR2 family protein [Nocardioides sp. C4-1]|uniref:SIR2 family protein n=1 Tax=Nocardioides sp. C4-1 TaxID=3151851 RepID=UPI0032639150